MIELLVVISVSLILTGMLLPVLSQVRGRVDRVISASQMRQIGFAMHMYAKDHNERLPRSEMLRQGLPLELMIAHVSDPMIGWDGFGRLYDEQYLVVPEIFYCPANEGQHTYDRYRVDWIDPKGGDIYTNYHYCGDVDWEDLSRLRRLEEGERLMLATDGFRTTTDLNHEYGMNQLLADGSVQWQENAQLNTLHILPTGVVPVDQSSYVSVWRELSK
jgi:type II secretory pathway pseudopilin PulG